MTSTGLAEKLAPSLKEAIFIGVNGGATATHVSVVDYQGNELSHKEGASSNQNNIGFDNALKNITTTIDGALQSSNSRLSNVRGICLTLAGCDRPSDKSKWINSIQEYFTGHGCNAKNVLVEAYNDSIGVLASGSPKEMEGIVVICGTGYIVCGYKQGDLEHCFRAGGWGPLLGDQSSGYALGEATLRAAAYAHDGGDATPLYKAVMEQYQLHDFNDVIGHVYGKDKDNHALVASVAPLALKYYEQCPIARGIVDDSIEQLVKRILVVVDKMYGTNQCQKSKEKTQHEKKDNSHCSSSHDHGHSHGHGHTHTHTHNDNEHSNIVIICGGSLLTKSPLFYDLLKRKLGWHLSCNAIQARLQWLLPKNTPEYGAALHSRHQFDKKFHENMQSFAPILDKKPPST